MTTSPTTRAAPAGARTLARIGLIGIVLYVLIDVLLAFLRPDYSLVRNAESDYGRGPWSWVMDVNFLVRGAMSLAVAGALYRSVHLNRRVGAGLVLLVVWSVGSALLAFFPDDLLGEPPTTHGQVHTWLAIVAFVAIMIGTILLSVGLRADPSWRGAALLLLVVSVLGVVAAVPLVMALGSDHIGIGERAYLAVEILWMAVAAVLVLRCGTARPAR